MCQVNGPSYSVQCDHCGESMRNADDICPHCKHNYNGGTMSEQQVLPIPEIYRDKRGDWTEDSSHENGNYSSHCCYCERTFVGHKRRVVCKLCATLREKEAESATLLASLAQSEAERDRLQGKHKALLVAIDDCPTGREYLDADKLVSAFIKEQIRLQADLARERELNQGLRQLLKQYRTAPYLHTLGTNMCMNDEFGDTRCPICIEADSLLESKPVEEE